MRNDYPAWASRWRVPLGFAFAIAYLIISRPKLPLLIAGGSVALVGLCLRAWAAGSLEKGQRLATAGPFARTRNPLYLGSFVLGIGFLIAGASWILAAIFVALFSFIYLPVIRREEVFLRQKFGAEFEEYARRVPLFFPASVRGAGSAGNFRWARYYQNREYNAALGYALMMVFLSVKLMLR